ncbi:MAG: BamA/TamA family outer membrane protein [Petrimonas sp.]|nr:BamA/TamA family outer membrane protein [Petrimonas sp.]
MKKYISYIVIAFFLIACNATKQVPQGSYLLNKVKINTDTKTVGESDLKPFLRQKPNASVPVLGRVRLHMYNMAGNDSTWISKRFRKWGEPPVLFSERLTAVSAEQIRMEMNNRGYLNAEVDTVVERKNKKANVDYNVTGHDPYRILHYRDTVRSADTTIHNILNERKRLNFIKEDDIFDMKVLEDGRINMTKTLRNNGYYNFSKDFFYFLADTTVGTHQVDLTLELKNPTDSTVHQQFYMGNVTVYNGVDASILNDSTKHNLLDTIKYKDINVVSEREQFLLPQAIYYNTFIRPGKLYSDRVMERTYSSLNDLGSVSQTMINLTPAFRNDSNFLDTRIALTPGNLHYMQFGIDGTNSAGDLGVATNLTYEHRNIFKGGERLRIRLNGAYEFITASDSSNLLDQSFYEYGSEVFLSIPQLLLPWLMKKLKDQPSASTEFSIGANFQKRPEYLRQFFNLTSRMQWSSSDWKLTHVIEPIDINYVRMPWVSKLFRDQYLSDNSNPILRYSYEEQLIALTSYYVSYSNSASENLPKYPFRIRTGIEVAGHLPRLVATLGGSTTNENGQKKILGIPYAEYVKGDFDISSTFPIDEKNVLAGHFAAGLAYPYGNSKVLPFEKRYFGGGANSIRGWNTRSLGPGSYTRDSVGYDFVNKTGDIKLEMSLEYRRTLTKLFQLAGYIDAGNIWTIKNYTVQQGGYFQWNKFYKEIAVSYGLGLRIDLKFLLLRFDTGMKAHNPALPAGQRWTIFRPSFRRDFAFHFAIGYPF